MESPFARVRQRLAAQIDQDIAATPVDVVVMGPGSTSSSKGASLRKFIVSEARAFGASIQPEHQDLINDASERLGAGHNLVIFEIKLVEITDLVILIPDSPGSLCELGLFSFNDRFCHKLVILVNQDFRSDDSYINEGPLKLAQHNQAEVIYVDYEDHASAWSKVRDRIEQTRASILGKKAGS